MTFGLFIYSTMGFALELQRQGEQGNLSSTDVRISLLYCCQASWDGKSKKRAIAILPSMLIESLVG